MSDLIEWNLIFNETEGQVINLISVPLWTCRDDGMEMKVRQTEDDEEEEEKK